MPNANIKPSDRAPVLAVIDPDAYTAATYTSGWVDMSLWESLLVIVFAGTLGSGATLDAKLEQATSAAGAGAKDITGKAITQLTQAGTDSDKQAVINCQSEDLDVEGGFRYVRLSMTVGNATSDAGGVVLGMDPRYAPTDASTVDEVVG